MFVATILLATTRSLVSQNHTILNVEALSLIGGLLVPLLTALVTKVHASRIIKSVSTAVLSAVAGGIAIALQSHGSVILSTWILGMGVSFITAIASYYGFWKPTGIAPTISSATANTGIGGNTGAPADTSAPAGDGTDAAASTPAP